MTSVCVCQVMSMGRNVPIGEGKKGSLFEDSTDSDNDTERKLLLRRISTSKCVGRLVSLPHFVQCLVSEFGRVLNLIDSWQGRGEGVPMCGPGQCLE